MSAPTNRSLSKLAFFSAAIVWGASFAFQKEMVREIGALDFTFWNFFISAVVFWVYAILKDVKITYRLREGIVLGVFLAGIEIFQMVGLKFASAADTAFLTNLGMLLIPYLGWLLLRHKVTLENNIALALAIVGMYLLVGGVSGFGLGTSMLLLSALSMAYYFLYLERYDSERNSHLLALLVQQFLVISAISAAASWLVGAPLSVERSRVPDLLWLTIVFTTIPYAVVQWAGKYADEMIAAIYDGVVEPLVGGIVAWVAFAEPTTPLSVGGGVLMVFAFGFGAIFSKRHFLLKRLKALGNYVR